MGGCSSARGKFHQDFTTPLAENNVEYFHSALVQGSSSDQHFLFFPDVCNSDRVIGDHDKRACDPMLESLDLNSNPEMASRPEIRVPNSLQYERFCERILPPQSYSAFQSDYIHITIFKQFVYVMITYPLHYPLTQNYYLRKLF